MGWSCWWHKHPMQPLSLWGEAGWREIKKVPLRMCVHINCSANTGFAIGMSALKMAKASYYQDEHPYAASQGKLWPALIKCYFLGMLLCCSHQSYLREGQKGFVSLLSLLTRCNIKYWHISTGKRDRAWLIMAKLTCLLSSLGKEHQAQETTMQLIH